VAPGRQDQETARHEKANLQPQLAPKRPRRMPLSNTSDEESQSRPLTAAYMPTIVNAILEAHHIHPLLLLLVTTRSIILENQSPKAKPLPKIPWISVSLFY